VDQDLLQAWQRIIGGMCDGMAANAVATLVLTDTWKRGLLSEEKLVADLRRFKRVHLELAIIATCAWMSKARLRRLNKMEMIKILMR
jgi:hypothetical protein